MVWAIWGGQGLRFFAAICIASVTAACVPTGAGKSLDPTSVVDDSKAQPRLATYACGENGTVTIENMNSSVHLTEPDGSQVDLPASPPTQHSRFGEPPYALVLEGNEALLMKNGKEPITCKR